MIDPAVADRLKTALGPKGWTTNTDEIAPHLKEWRDTYRGETTLMLKPGSTQEVSAALKICHETGTAIVPQGGNTGLVGGALPFGQVLLWLGRMNRVRALDALNDTLTVDAGCVLATAQKVAEDADRLFPMSLGSEGSCTIGGNLSTNSGGTAVLRYGNMRDLVLGLEVVLPDGRIWDGLRGLRKDNTGYDLKQLFVGAEGTLGVITGAVLKLFPKPRATETAWIAVPSAEAAVELLALAQGTSGGSVSGFELMARLPIEFVLRHIPGTGDPLAQPSPWYVLMEMTSGRTQGLRETIETVLEEGLRLGLVRDAAIAENEAKRAALWRLRDSISESQNKEGPRAAQDVAVPRSAIARFMTEAGKAIHRLDPGLRVVAFGHIGDGNVHYNVNAAPGMSREAFRALVPAINRVVYDLAVGHGGSISAEHGLGKMKREAILRYKSETEIGMMRALKATLDPKGIMNPGKVL